MICNRIVPLTFILLLCLSILACSSPKIETPHAKGYSIVLTNDFSFPGRKRIGISIVAENNELSFEEKAQTVMKAAMDIQEKHSAQMVSVLMEYSKESSGIGFVSAKAEYSPDNGGYSGDQNYTWNVESTRSNPTKLQIDSLKLWGAHRNSFKNDGMVDEPKLKAFIAKQLRIDPGDVDLPFITLERYLHK